MSKLYAVYPGYIVSKTDNNVHWLSFTKLCKLYNVKPSDCVNMSKEHSFRGMDTSKLIQLRPSYEGNYKIPTN